MLYTFIIDITNFDLIPTDSIKTWLFSLTDSMSDDSFSSLGYESNNIIDSLGSMLLYLAGLIIAVIITLLMRLLAKKYQL